MRCFPAFLFASFGHYSGHLRMCYCPAFLFASSIYYTDFHPMFSFLGIIRNFFLCTIFCTFLFSFHLSRKCCESVAGGMYDVSTCHGNAAKVCQVEGMMFPPVAEMPEKCARWEVRCFHLSRKCCKSVSGGRYDASTCHGNAAKVWQVGGMMLPPVMEMWEKYDRWAV